MSAAAPGGPRRSSHVDMPVAYAAVGASADEDLMRFPPEGFTPFEDAVRLGSGHDRFVLAASLLMTWGAQRGAGYTVSDIVRGDGGRYEGVKFDDEGRPEPGLEEEEHFGPDGEPYLTAGTTANISRPGDKHQIPVLVIFTVNESHTVGFALGNTDESGAVGEQLFAIELRGDNSVWATARGFVTVPKSGILGLKGRNLVKEELIAAKQQLDALAPVSIAGSGLLRPDPAADTESSEPGRES
ncbi:MAG: DUF1990 family protein [Leucobacter sp.]